MKPRALVLSFTPLDRDPRVHRQIRILSREFDVVAVGQADPKIAGVSPIVLEASPKPLARRLSGAARLLLRRHEAYYWAQSAVREVLDRTAELTPDLVVANDIDALPVALRLARGAPLIFDAHEYAPREFDDQWRFRLLHRPLREYLCRRYIPECAEMLTVCDGIAERYAAETGVSPVVVWNAPDYEELAPRPPQAPSIRMVHHGGAMRGRRLETMIETLRLLDSRFSLDFMLVASDPSYLDELRRKAADCPRIRFRDPVPMTELSRTLNEYDVGLYLLQPTNFNNYHALPNKFFEFVQARLAVAIGPSPEMARLVAERGVGIVSPDFTPQSLAAELGKLDETQLSDFKSASHRAARDMSAERAERQLLEIANRALMRANEVA